MISLGHDLSSLCSRWMWKTSLTSSLDTESLSHSNRTPSSRIPSLSRSCIMLMTMHLPSKGQTLSGQRKGYVPVHRPPWHCFLLNCRLNFICSSFVAYVIKCIAWASVSQGLFMSVLHIACCNPCAIRWQWLASTVRVAFVT